MPSCQVLVFFQTGGWRTKDQGHPSACKCPRCAFAAQWEFFTFAVQEMCSIFTFKQRGEVFRLTENISGVLQQNKARSHMKPFLLDTDDTWNQELLCDFVSSGPLVGKSRGQAIDCFHRQNFSRNWSCIQDTCVWHVSSAMWKQEAYFTDEAPFFHWRLGPTDSQRRMKNK